MRVAVLRGVLPLQGVGDVQVSQGQAGCQRRAANAEAPHLFPHGARESWPYCSSRWRLRRDPAHNTTTRDEGGISIIYGNDAIHDDRVHRCVSSPLNDCYAASESSFDDAAALHSERIVIRSAAISLILDLTRCPVFFGTLEQFWSCGLFQPSFFASDIN